MGNDVPSAAGFALLPSHSFSEVERNRMKILCYCARVDILGGLAFAIMLC